MKRFIAQYAFIAGLMVIFLFIFGFTYRDRIAQFFNMSREPLVEENPVALDFSAISRLGEGVGTPAPSLPAPSPSRGAAAVKKPPSYKGRHPQEVRPVPEEVKLFSDDQKKKIYVAIENFGQSVLENSDFLRGWLQLGLYKKVIGDFEGARDAWEYASIIRPLNSVSFANLGELYWRYIADYPKSERNFRTALKNKPDDMGVYVSLSDLYFYSYKEKAELADDILLEGLAKNSSNTDLMKHLATLYERRREYAKAVEWWQKALDQDPQNTSIIGSIDQLKKKMNQ